MYEDVGNKITDYVVTVVVIICIGWIIFGAYLFEGSVTLGLIVMVVGCAFTWFSGLMLYSYGRLVQNTEQLYELEVIKNDVSILKGCMEQLVQIQVDMQNKQSGVAGNIINEQIQVKTISAPKMSKEPAIIAGEKMFYFASRIDKDISCPNCGRIQKGDRTRCSDCGAWFVYENE